MRVEMFESKVATVNGFIDEQDSASCSQTFADHIDRVLWSIGVLGLPCRWIPREYDGFTVLHEAAMIEASGHIPSPPQPGSYAHVVRREPQ